MNEDVVSRSFLKKQVPKSVSLCECWASRKQKVSTVLHDVQVRSQHVPLARLLPGFE